MSRRWFDLVLVILWGVLLAGCAGTNIQPYQGEKPKLDPLVYFDGTVEAWGIFEGRSGEVQRQFTATFVGERDGDRMRLEETIQYRDGDVKSRVWNIEKLEEGRYRFESEDVIGESPIAKQAGNVLHMSYVLQVEAEDSQWNLHFDDTMFLQDEKTLLTRTTVSKWGFTVGRVFITYRKVGGSS